ncbi:hypothetical protein HCC61_15915 [Streptomyces sp. HNM0575]|uniref:hypothetical protein n=1 Tax=Streptomyces sp. HNM0575 TaxID=2716338 RepID=UPI00145D179D|nr:hypothetical protein [Streptomyces sp. HNM0575]NLU74149.1 hypothetical protein [Streptomyces sp. HNM0575]
MLKHGLRRRLALLASATALLLPLGIAQAGAAPATAHTASAAGPIPGAYISPWGSADVAMSPQFKQWTEREGITVEAISPFKMHPDGNGFSMPIGSTAGDGLDSKGRIYYPGGLRLHLAATGQTVTLKPTWIRVMPRPGYAAGVELNGRTISEETQIADTDYVEAMEGARPSPTGFRLERIPFYFTQEAEDLIETYSDLDAPDAGTPFGTLTPHFDYVPGQPAFPGLPG